MKSRKLVTSRRLALMASRALCWQPRHQQHEEAADEDASTGGREPAAGPGVSKLVICARCRTGQMISPGPPCASQPAGRGAYAKAQLWRGQGPSGSRGPPTSAATGNNSLSSAPAALPPSASAAWTSVPGALRGGHHFLDNQRSVRKLTLLSRIRPLRSDDNRTGARRGH